MTSHADASDLPYGGRSALLDRALAELLEQAPELQAAAVVSFDGLPMASALPAGMDEDRVAAMSAALLSLGERAADGLGRGELSQIYVEGENGTVFLVSAQDEAVLVAVAARRAKVGLMLFEVRRAAHAVGAALRDEPLPAPDPVVPPTLVPLPTPVDEAEIGAVTLDHDDLDGAPAPGWEATDDLAEPVDPEELPPDPAQETYPHEEPAPSYEALFEDYDESAAESDYATPPTEQEYVPAQDPPADETDEPAETEEPVEGAASEEPAAIDVTSGPAPWPADVLPEPPAAYGEPWPEPGVVEEQAAPAAYVAQPEPAPAYTPPAAWYDPSPKVAYSPPVTAPGGVYGVWSPYPGPATS